MKGAASCFVVLVGVLLGCAGSPAEDSAPVSVEPPTGSPPLPIQQHEGAERLLLKGGPYRDVAVDDLICAVEESGGIKCWWDNVNNLESVAGVPKGNFIKVITGGAFVGGITADNLLDYVHTRQPDRFPFGAPYSDKPYNGFAAQGSALCAVDGVGLHCEDVTKGIDPIKVEFPGAVSIAAGDSVGCAINDQGVATCAKWGFKADDPPADEAFQSLGLKYRYACGLRKDGSARCWGSLTRTPEEPFKQLSVDSSVCALDMDGNVVMWRPKSEKAFRVKPTTGVFTTLDAGSSYCCGLRDDGKVECLRWLY